MPRELAVILEGTIEAGCTLEERNELYENSREIGAALEQLGYRTEVVALTLDVDRARRRLALLKPKFVFNLVDTVEGKDSLIAIAPLLLEHMKIPFTGAGSTATSTSCHKITAKQLLQSDKLPTAPWLAGYEIDNLKKKLTTPYIVKSLTEQASAGLFKDSVAHSARDLKAVYQDRVTNYGGEWFAEAFIDGREFNQAIVATPEGPLALPTAEIVFTKDFPKDQPKIVDFAAKWYTQSPEYIGTVRSFKFSKKDAPILAELKKIALRAWDIFGLTGYARLDFRVDAKGNPYVLEVNSNPFLTANEGMGVAAQRAGIDFTALVGYIVDDAIRRGHDAQNRAKKAVA